ncbi:MAG: carboxypeptidase-like regulatory domain-containing protein [Bryobacteraceae bacterium]
MRTALLLATSAVLAMPFYVQCAPLPLVPGGAIAGNVKNSLGVSQMGATVVLYNRADSIVRQAMTNEKGAFVFEGLLPDFYSVRVSLSSFVPALRRNIAVQPGMESILTINLATVFSSVELIYTGPPRGGLMSDEWKWVLRGSASSRPVLRYRVPGSTSASKSGMFSETRGLVAVSAGDSAAYGTSGSQTDLGTAFSVATSINGSSHLQFSGNVGYSTNSATPATSFRTTYSRDDASALAPAVTLTMRQLYLPNRAGVGLVAGSGNGAPAYRSMALSVIDRLQISDGVKLEYGMSAETVSFVDHVNFISPFARATFDLNGAGAVQVAFSSGATPAELAVRSPQSLEGDALQNDALKQDLVALGMLPRVSLRDGRARIQRDENVELGYKKVFGHTKVRASVYHETIGNTALAVASPEGFLPETDLLADPGSRTNLFNAGRFHSLGYTASVERRLGEHVDLLIAAGRAGAFSAKQVILQQGDADGLREALEHVQRTWITARLSARLPKAGTRIISSYGWTDFRSLMPAHAYLTDSPSRDTGWNLSFRQPLPGIFGMGGRIEASAEMRNMLAQGYLSLNTSDGRRVVLIQSPRAVRGGLAFIF